MSKNNINGKKYFGWIYQLKKLGYLIPYYLKSRLGNKKPLMAGVKLTHRCNLKCKHCPFWKKETKPLTFDTVIDSLKKLHDHGVRILIFEGGEPFLWKHGKHDIRDVVNKAKELFFSVGITTNGTLPIDVDSDMVWVSIDGLEKTHDSIRGKCFGRILANIKNSTHPRIYGHITINSLNWKEIPDLVKFLSDKVKGITIQFHYPYDRENDGLFLSFDKRAQLINELIKLKKQGYPLLDSYACLKALKDNRWKCRPWMLASVDNEGRITLGCYLTDRAEISCVKCGFAAHTELSLAYNGSIGAILAGSRILF